MIKKKKVNKKKLDLILLVLFPILASIISLVFEIGFVGGILLFMVVPSIYLSFRNPKKIKKSFLFSIFFSIPFSFVGDYLAVINKVWQTPSIYRIFGVVSIEQFLWGFCFIYLVIIFYEYFLDKGRDNKLSKDFKHMVIYLTIMAISLLFFIFFMPSLLIFDYAYLFMGIFFIIFPLIFLYKPIAKAFPKFLVATIYFIFFDLIYEITALKLDHWSFPGSQFIGKISLGGMMFPVEELIFWMGLGVIMILSWYEFFADDKK
jgi:hypothetical protein